MPQPVYNCLTVQVLKNKSATDNAQIPAVGASVAFYRAGVTAKNAVTVPAGASGVAIPVYDTGTLLAGEGIRVGSTNGALLVDSIPDSSTLVVSNGSSTAIAITAGTRLLPTTGRPAVFVDPIASVAAPSSTVYADTNGFATAYLRSDRVDYVVSGTGVTARVASDVRPGIGPGSPGWINAAEYSSLQTALDACPDGGRLYIPGGTYTVPSGGLRILKAVEIFGDGCVATILQPHSPNTPNQPVIVIDASGETIRNINLHDFKISGFGWQYGRDGLESNHGIVCYCSASTQATEMRIERVIVANTSGDGLHFAGTDIGAGAIVFLYGLCVQAIECQGTGFYIENSTMVEFHNCYANGNYLYGAFCRNGMLSWYTCAFENNCRRSTETDAKPGDETTRYTADRGAQLFMQDCIPARIESCDFESFGVTPTVPDRLANTGIGILNCTGAVVSNCRFYTPPTGVTAPESIPESILKQIDGRGIHVLGATGTGWVTILPNSFYDVAIPIVVDQNATNVSVFAQQSSQEASTVPESQSLDLPGFTIPSLPSSQIASSLSQDTCQMVYDRTNARLLLWNGQQWEVIN